MLFSHNSYRIIAGNNKTGTMEISTAGTGQAKGIANSSEDAAAEAMKELAQNMLRYPSTKPDDDISQALQPHRSRRQESRQTEGTTRRQVTTFLPALRQTP
jgi:hypothetical protein